jgi:hypothetical protein
MNNTAELLLALSKKELETLRGLFKRLPAFGPPGSDTACSELEHELLVLIFEGTELTNE